jgi:hypothetical protein
LATKTAECRPPIVSVAARMYSGKASPSIAYHSPFASQQKDMHSDRWHSCVPKKIRSGLGLKLGEDASSTTELMGGREPKRFQVMATRERVSWRRTENLMLWSDSYFCIQYYLKRSKGKPTLCIIFPLQAKRD